MSRTRVLTLLIAAVVAACGATSSEPPVTFPTVGPTWVAHPPTPDPPVDPANPEPQIVRSPVVLTDIDIQALGGGRLEFLVQGELPTPCHALRAEVGSGGPDGAIHLSFWAEVPIEDDICVTVTQPFERLMALDGLAAGTYSVVLDGKQISTIDLPAALAAGA